jgi:SAM-dependent methyltransferase
MPALYDSWAKYYDIAEGDRSIFIDFYSTVVAQNTRSLIELGCGTGVITAALGQLMARNQGGYAALRVTGLDESSEMLRVARARDRNIEWIRGDMRSPPVIGTYDLVLCSFNVLQMFLNTDDLRAVLRSARGLLADKGIFAFDIYQPNVAYLTTPQKNRLVRAVAGGDGRMLEVREDFVYDPTTYIMTLDWRLVDSARPEWALETMHYHLRQYFAEEVEQMLRAAGLTIKERYGDFDQSPFTAGSKKQIIVCERAQVTSS